jgi:hypothetical protein
VRTATPDGGTLVLDAAGLSGYLDQERRTVALLEIAERNDLELVMCAATLIEATHSRTRAPRLHWVLSRIRVEPVTLATARASSALLRKAGLHGHKYAIDAMVAEMALRQPRPVSMITSDVDDMSKLCGPGVRLVAV